MSLGSKLAQQEGEQASGSGPPTIYTDTIVGGDPSIILNPGAGSGFGMFQPQPTPYAHFIPYGFHNIANPGIPEYAFAPTPLLDQYGSGVGGRHRHGQVRGGSGEDGSLAGTAGVPVAHDGLSVRGGPSASTSAPARAFTAASPTDGFGAGAGTGAGAGSGIQSGVVGGGRGIGGTGVIRGLGHGTSTPSRASTTVITSASGNSAGYSGSNGGSGSTNNMHPHSYNLNIPIPVPPRRHNQHQLNHNQPSHRDHRQQSRNQDQNQHQYRHLSLLQNSHIGERDRTSISTTGSLLPYEMNQPSELEQAGLSQQQAAATEFTPQIEGSLVGEKVPSQAIAEQYAGADSVFVVKTLALPQTYSHYRPILGDGNCGWRAIAFAYFEVLVQSGDINKLQTELQRIIGLNRYIESFVGQDPAILEDMVGETVEVFNDVITAMSGGNDPMPILMVKFNDVNVAPYLVYHLRLLAQSKMKENSAQYEEWLDDDVESYIRSTIMPVDKEIDHICLTLLHDVLLKPANIMLEIAYLDRSEGTEVNVHRMPEEANGQDEPPLGSVTLLYRPGHYDILYRDLPVHIPPVVAVPVPVDIQVNRATYQNTEFQHVRAIPEDYTIDMSAMAMIPGLASEALSPFAPPSTTPSPADQYAASPASSWVPQPYTHDGLSAPSPNQPSPPHQQATVHQLRFSKYNFPNLPEMAAESSSNCEPPYSTPSFKNSHYNTAHFSNMNFQPEIYRPEAEEEASSSGHGKSRGRKRSSEHCSGIKKEK